MHIFNSHKGQLGLHLPDGLIVDNFAGGGGASIGLEMGTGRPVDIAINHNHQAITMHKANHPDTAHFEECVWDIDPLIETKGQPVHLAWFSPDCTHHSKARGGKPREKNIRALAWVKIKWALLKRPNIMMLENVEEFKSWGPLDDDGQPIESQKGEWFEAFVAMLTTGISRDHDAVKELLEYLPEGTDITPIFTGLGYKVEWRELKACDYGAPTIRKRLFMIARCDGNDIVWPEPTHAAPDSEAVKSGHLKPFRTAAEIIDWSIPGKSIFNRAKPLADNTMKRIYKGLEKFVFNNPNPFIVRIGHTGFGGDGMQYPIDKPLTTVTTKAEHCLVIPTIVKHYGGGYKGSGTDIKKPLSTVTTVDHHALVASYLIKFRGQNVGHKMDEPLHTITAGGNHLAEVRAFIVKYYGASVGHGMNEPLHTITTKERFGLVTIHGEDYQIVDIQMRMLQPHELFAAQGFPKGYLHEITDPETGRPLSKAAQVRMCGNSVSPCVVAALSKANFPQAFKEEIAA